MLFQPKSRGKGGGSRARKGKMREQEDESREQGKNGEQREGEGSENRQGNRRETDGRLAGKPAGTGAAKKAVDETGHKTESPLENQRERGGEEKCFYL